MTTIVYPDNEPLRPTLRKDDTHGRDLCILIGDAWVEIRNVSVQQLRWFADDLERLAKEMEAAK